jgi:hypothetical protein
MRTTLDIDTPVLEELKRLQKKQATEKKSLGRLVSELLTEALARREREVRESVGFEWVSKQMKALVDLEDKDALYAELDHDR